MQIELILSLIALVVVPLWFIYHEVYEDGVFGRISLCGIAFNAAIMLMAMFIDGWKYELTLEITILICSFAVFICWHLWRFEKRVVVNKRAKDGEIDRRKLLT